MTLLLFFEMVFVLVSTATSRSTPHDKLRIPLKYVWIITLDFLRQHDQQGKPKANAILLVYLNRR